MIDDDCSKINWLGPKALGWQGKSCRTNGPITEPQLRKVCAIKLAGPARKLDEFSENPLDPDRRRACWRHCPTAKPNFPSFQFSLKGFAFHFFSKKSPLANKKKQHEKIHKTQSIPVESLLARSWWLSFTQRAFWTLRLLWPWSAKIARSMIDGSLSGFICFEWISRSIKLKIVSSVCFSPDSASARSSRWVSREAGDTNSPRAHNR